MSRPPLASPTFFSPSVLTPDVAPVQGSVNEATVPIDDFRRIVTEIRSF